MIGVGRFSLAIVGVALIGATGCPRANAVPTAVVAKPAAPATQTAASAAAETAPETAPPASGDPSLFPERKTGWTEVDTAKASTITALAREYIAFLRRSRTARTTIATLIDSFRAANGTEHVDGRKAKPGSLIYFRDSTGTAVTLVRVGKRPLTDGLRVVVAPVDAPHFVLKQTPATRRDNFTMFETYVYGPMALRNWMVTPLALQLFLARNNKPPLEIVIGDDPTEPVFSIPDLLPHLSRKAQRRTTIDSAERMDALAAVSETGLSTLLKRFKISEADLSAAEGKLVPITEPRFVGVDRGLVGGYGQQHRSMAFAATTALLRAKGDRTAIVILVDRTLGGGAGRAGKGYVTRSLSRVLSALWPSKGGPDLLDAQRVLHRTDLLNGRRLEGAHHAGIVLNFRGDDSLPVGADLVLRSFRAAGSAYQISGKSGWGSPAREFASLDVNATDFSIASEGHDRPHELISTLDLFGTVAGLASFFGFERGQE